MPNKGRAFSGIRPTGHDHPGNYIVDLQHARTTVEECSNLRRSIAPKTIAEVRQAGRLPG